MITGGFRTIILLPEKGPLCAFPTTPDDVLAKECTIHIFKFSGSSPTGTAESHQIVKFSDYKTATELEHYIASALYEPEGSKYAGTPVFSVHANAVLLTLYRWYLIRNGSPAVTINYTMGMYKSRCVDICEAFYSPTILSLERRSSFSYLDVVKWLGLLETDNPEDDCLSALNHLCHSL